jgi:radical SAM protein with 4Fe4S-binding SPASM domain
MDDYNRIVKKTMEKNIPFMVHWELTYRCNMTCGHCYCAHNNAKKELTFEEIKSVIDALADMQALYLTFSGGEILAREDFIPIANYARTRGFALRLLTNGTLITSDIADRIKQLNPVSVEMSLYAAEAGLHDVITGSEGSFEKTVQSFQMLRKRGVGTKVKSLLMKQNFDQVAKLKGMSLELGADFVYDMTVFPKDDGHKGPLQYRLDEESMTEIFQGDHTAVSFEPQDSVNNDTFMCSAGLNNLLISPYGDVSPCVGLKESAGNVREQSLGKTFSSPVFQRVRATDLSELSACRACDLGPYCRRCPGLAAAEDGDYLGPSTAACRLAGALKEVSNKKTCVEG